MHGNLDTPLSGAKQEEIADLIEMVRWAPSAVNKQPWRIIAADGRYHFYEKKDKGYVSDAAGDLQKIDVGIALCHFVMGLEEQGKHTEILVSDPGIRIPDSMEYIASAGLRQFVAAHKKMNGALTLRHVSDEIMGVIKITGLDKRMRFE